MWETTRFLDGNREEIGFPSKGPFMRLKTVIIKGINPPSIRYSTMTKSAIVLLAVALFAFSNGVLASEEINGNPFFSMKITFYVLVHSQTEILHRSSTVPFVRPRDYDLRLGCVDVRCGQHWVERLHRRRYHCSC